MAFVTRVLGDGPFQALSLQLAEHDYRLKSRRLKERLYDT